MTRTIWTPTLAWLAAVTAALVLALAAPNESNFLGQLPKLSVKRLDQQRIVLPQELPAQRTLALVAFRSSHREEIRQLDPGAAAGSGRLDRLVQDAGAEGPREASALAAISRAF